MSLADISKKFSINRGFFDKTHPAELLGASLDEWEFKLNYDLDEIQTLDEEKIASLRESIYQEIITCLEAGKVDNSHINRFTYQIINYVDSKYGHLDRERMYLRIDRETVRSTLVTVMARVYKHGKYIYIGVDSYAIGPLRLWSAIFHGFLLIFFFLPIGLTALTSILGGFGAFLSRLASPAAAIGGLASGIVLGFIFFLYIRLFWIKFIKAIFQREDFLSALRQSFNRPIAYNSFDVDDVLMFLKILFPLVTESIRKSFQEYGIDLKDDKDYLKEIAERSVSGEITINTGGGGIFGSIFGGSNNSVK